MSVYIFVSLTHIICFLTIYRQQKCRDRIHLKNKANMIYLPALPEITTVYKVLVIKIFSLMHAFVDK